MRRQIILDTETTGLSTSAGHRIIEIGCLEMVDRRFNGRSFHRYLNPQRPVDEGAFAVHGLSDQFLQDKPLFGAIAEELLEFIHGAELIIHNAAFDLEFLNYELKLLDQNAIPLDKRCDVIDTLLLARSKHPGQSNSLDALCRRYQIDNSRRDLHGALIDAELLGKVYMAMTSGQGQLFVVDGATGPSVAIESLPGATTVKTQREALPVIQPTAEELAAHLAFIEILKEKSIKE